MTGVQTLATFIFINFPLKIDWKALTWRISKRNVFMVFFLSFSWIFQSYHRRYMAEILPIRRKTLSNQSIHSIISWYDNFIIARPSMLGTRGHWAASVLYLATPIVTRSSLRTRDIHTCCGALDSACFMTKVCRNWDLNTRPSACKANALVN